MKKPPMPPMPAGPALAGPAPIVPMTEGEVTLNIPKSTFDQIHGIVMELAGMLDQFKSGIDAEEAGETMESDMAMEAGDEADLAAFAQELSSRSKV